MNADNPTLGRPRDIGLRTIVLRTALELVGTEGYASVTINRIADIAKVSRPTIYRWWPSKGAIILEAVIEQAEQHASLPEAHGSVVTFLRNTFRLSYGSVGPAVVGIMADAQHDAKLHQQLQTALISPRRTMLSELLQGLAADRGADFIMPVSTVVDMLFGAMWYRLLNSHDTLDKNFAEQLARAAEALLLPQDK